MRPTGAFYARCDCATYSDTYARHPTHGSTPYSRERLVVGSNPTAGATRLLIQPVNILIGWRLPPGHGAFVPAFVMGILTATDGNLDGHARV
jgi:hypothetical protein